MKIKKNIASWLGVAIIGVVLGLCIQFGKAWTEPSAAPPDGNVGAPINTGDNSQTKEGNLILNSLAHFATGLTVNGAMDILGGKGYTDMAHLTVATDPDNTLVTKNYVDGLEGGGVVVVAESSNAAFSQAQCDAIQAWLDAGKGVDSFLCITGARSSYFTHNKPGLTLTNCNTGSQLFMVGQQTGASTMICSVGSSCYSSGNSCAGGWKLLGLGAGTDDGTTTVTAEAVPTCRVATASHNGNFNGGSLADSMCADEFGSGWKFGDFGQFSGSAIAQTVSMGDFWFKDLDGYSGGVYPGNCSNWTSGLSSATGPSFHAASGEWTVGVPTCNSVLRFVCCNW